MNLERIAHVDWHEKTIVVQVGEPTDAAVAFVVLGRLLLNTPGALKGRDRELAAELLESLVPADAFPASFVVPR